MTVAPERAPSRLYTPADTQPPTVASVVAAGGTVVRHRWTPVLYGASLSSGAVSLLAVAAYWRGADDLFGWALVVALTLAVVAFLALAEGARDDRNHAEVVEETIPQVSGGVR